MKLDLKHLRSVAEAATIEPGHTIEYKYWEKFRVDITPAIVLALIERIEKLEGALKHIHRHTKESWCQGYCLDALEGGDT